MMRQFEKVSYSDKGILPTRNDKGSAGYDIYTPEKLVIKPGEIVKFKTDIKAKLCEQDVLMLYVRSSIGIKKNLMLCNGTGVIDSTYYNNPDNEGNIICALYNYGKEEVTIEAGDRVVQAVLMPYYIMDNDTYLNEERIGGIGSSGE